MNKLTPKNLKCPSCTKLVYILNNIHAFLKCMTQSHFKVIELCGLLKLAKYICCKIVARFQSREKLLQIITGNIFFPKIHLLKEKKILLLYITLFYYLLLFYIILILFFLFFVQKRAPFVRGPRTVSPFAPL